MEIIRANSIDGHLSFKRFAFQATIANFFIAILYTWIASIPTAAHEFPFSMNIQGNLINDWHFGRVEYDDDTGVLEAATFDYQMPSPAGFRSVDLQGTFLTKEKGSVRILKPIEGISLEVTSDNISTLDHYAEVYNADLAIAFTFLGNLGRSDTRLYQEQSGKIEELIRGEKKTFVYREKGLRITLCIGNLREQQSIETPKVLSQTSESLSLLQRSPNLSSEDLVTARQMLKSTEDISTLDSIRVIYALVKYYAEQKDWQSLETIYNIAQGLMKNTNEVIQSRLQQDFYIYLIENILIAKDRSADFFRLSQRINADFTTWIHKNYVTQELQSEFRERIAYYVGTDNGPTTQRVDHRLELLASQLSIEDVISYFCNKSGATLEETSEIKGSSMAVLQEFTWIDATDARKISVNLWQLLDEYDRYGSPLNVEDLKKLPKLFQNLRTVHYWKNQSSEKLAESDYWHKAIDEWLVRETAGYEGQQDILLAVKSHVESIQANWLLPACKIKLTEFQWQHIEHETNKVIASNKGVALKPIEVVDLIVNMIVAESIYAGCPEEKRFSTSFLVSGNKLIVNPFNFFVYCEASK